MLKYYRSSQTFKNTFFTIFINLESQNAGLVDVQKDLN